MLKRHEVEILLKAGHPKTEVTRLSGVSLRSVNRIAEETPVVHVDDAAEREKRGIGRPSLVENFRKLVVTILEEKADLPSLEILRRVREAGYPGGKTALYALVASLRPKGIKPLVRFEGLPGEFSQHDFGQVDIEFLNGVIRRIHFFASRLKYSRFIRVSLVKDETVESLVRNLAEHLHSWGGKGFRDRLPRLRVDDEQTGNNPCPNCCSSVAPGLSPYRTLRSRPISLVR
jgi:hypothetical protein